MRADEMEALKKEYGDDLEITQSYHLHDEDEWNKWVISYKGIIVGSELVSKNFVKDYIARHIA